MWGMADHEDRAQMDIMDHQIHPMMIVSCIFIFLDFDGFVGVGLIPYNNKNVWNSSRRRKRRRRNGARCVWDGLHSMSLLNRNQFQDHWQIDTRLTTICISYFLIQQPQRMLKGTKKPKMNMKVSDPYITAILSNYISISDDCECIAPSWLLGMVKLHSKLS